MNKEEKIKSFDPNGIGELNGNLFGLPFTPEESEVIVIPVPWEVTVSYSTGTANGPQAILDASPQLDLFHPNLKDAWKYGISMLPISSEIKNTSNELRKISEEHIKNLENGENGIPETIKKIKLESEKLQHWIFNEAKNWSGKGKKICLVGGDHSTPLGLIEFLSSQYENIGILQIDAHADLRDSYEKFTYSHASIMFNALKISQISKLVQVGIRDYCESEFEIMDTHPKIDTFYDKTLKEEQFKGVSWDEQCEQIISKLPQNVYISFDIDGLDPKYCPNTGTPVPGGLEFQNALYLIEKIVNSGRKIVSFDINEVAPSQSEWDANVGARLLYNMAISMIQSDLN